MSYFDNIPQIQFEVKESCRKRSLSCLLCTMMKSMRIGITHQRQQV